MSTLIVEIDNENSAKKLSSFLSDLRFVKRVTSVKRKKEMISALKEHEEIKTAIVSRKNKAFAKYL